MRSWRNGSRGTGAARRLRAALDPVLDEPLPERLLASVRGAVQRHAAEVIALKRKAAPAGRAQWARSRPAWWEARCWAAAAAHAAADARHPRRQVLASGALARALTEQLASSQPPARRCRSVSAFGQERRLLPHVRAARKEYARGLACARTKPGGSRCWRRIRPRPPQATGRGFGAAAGVAHTLDELIAGEPLDAGRGRGARAGCSPEDHTGKLPRRAGCTARLEISS